MHVSISSTAQSRNMRLIVLVIGGFGQGVIMLPSSEFQSRKAGCRCPWYLVYNGTSIQRG
jgi:hypothetical protein